MTTPKPKSPKQPESPVLLLVKVLLGLFILQIVLSGFTLGFCLSSKPIESAVCKDPFAVTSESLRSAAGAVLAMLALYLRPPDQSP
jgi:hypothetical protein